MEFVGGLLLLVGLLTRFVSIPMMIIMLVAIASAKWGDVDSLQTLLGFEEISYFVMFAWLGIAGPGPGVARPFRPEGAAQGSAAVGLRRLTTQA